MKFVNYAGGALARYEVKPWDVAMADAGLFPVKGITHYRSATVDGVDVFYREAGPEDAPVLLLLHGFPSSSRMDVSSARKGSPRWP